VPDLPSETVVLAVRVGEESEPGGRVEERLAGRSAIFSIARGSSPSDAPSSCDPDESGTLAAVPPAVSSAAAGEPLADDQDDATPVPDSWEGPIPLSAASVEWQATAFDRADDCVLAPREAISEDTDARLDPSPHRAASDAAPTIPSFVRPPSYPRRQ
jgi:hypothetical protein